ncbi:hypothetical protein P691DRAFT_791252 [Macrolepiota fuliginosa MF-IS2]|uniref:Uncharacterized protein n=1 Tax=Macrolepiota fuliginosa MF-IS2 TaxID=1400762 RepID=A0A9P5X115_9AGAR|nr:hypothetical protein P691DRAFT_791252 [Macrolepiota fuliginosa MF-IS2]
MAPLLQRLWQIKHISLWLHHPNDEWSQPPVQWFIEQGVPVWYCWGDRENARENWERKLLTKSTSIYMWDWDLNGNFMQEQVCKSDREEKLLEYTNKQKHYDSFFNKWNCCEEWDTDDDTDDDNHAGETLHINIQLPTEKANVDVQPYPTAASDPKLSDTTVTFLNAQNQDLCTKSIMQTLFLVTLPKLMQVQVQHELNAIGFTYKAPTLPLPPLKTPKEEEDSNDDEMDIHLFNDALASLILWCRKDSFNKETDSNAQDTLIKCIFKVAKDFNLVTIVTLPTPSPPPPCTQPYSDEEDIHMEPPTPSHVFSEAAMQTPAPLPMPATPTPPSLPMTSAPATSTSSRPGPPPRPSFAEAAAKTLCPNTPPFMHQFYIEMPSAAGISFPDLVNQANIALTCAKSPLHIDSAQFTSGGIMCATASVPTQSDLDIIEATLPPKIARSWIVDILYFKPSTTELPNGQEIGNQLNPSPILVNIIKHMWFVHNSPKADSGTFWIGLMDSQ